MGQIDYLTIIRQRIDYSFARFVDYVFYFEFVPFHYHLFSKCIKVADTGRIVAVP